MVAANFLFILLNFPTLEIVIGIWIGRGLALGFSLERLLYGLGDIVALLLGLEFGDLLPQLGDLLVVAVSTGHLLLRVGVGVPLDV